jgi:hypothetical protein
MNNGWTIEEVTPEEAATAVPQTNTNPERHIMNTEANINNININVVFTDDQMQQFAERVAKAIVENHMATLHDEIEEHLDHGYIAEKLEAHIDYDNIAERIACDIDASDVAQYIDMNDLAAEIDKDDVARQIVDEHGDELFEGVAGWYDKDQLIDDLIKARVQTSTTRAMVTEKYVGMLFDQFGILKSSITQMPDMGLAYLNDLRESI